MKYRVISYFEDLQDDKHPYEVGDIYPRKGLKVTDDRIAELMGSDNRQKKPLIEEDTKDSKSTNEYDFE